MPHLNDTKQEAGTVSNSSSTDLLSDLSRTIESQHVIIKCQSEELQRATMLLAQKDALLKDYAKKLSDTKKELKRQREGRIWWILDAVTPELRFKR